MLLGGLGAAILTLTPRGETDDAAAADVAAVDRYLDQLSESTPRPATAPRQSEPPEDPKLAKEAARLDRAEPIVNAVLSSVR